METRKSAERGYFENNWLKSFHSFSFGEYYDREHMHFRDLRVINHDFIAAGAGFPTHPHRDMEIMTYILKGTVEHRDSMGTKAQILAGEIQVMSAGRGVTHSEYNPNQDSELELLQIWIMPNQAGLQPSYGQKKFTREDKLNKLCLLVSPDQAEGSLQIHQDVRVYGSLLEKDQTLTFQSPKGRFAWLQVATGALNVNGVELQKGDAISLNSDESKMQIQSLAAESDFVLFDLN